jgi:plastocyanin
MKPSKYILLASSIAYTILAIQVSCKPAPADSAAPADPAAPAAAAASVPAAAPLPASQPAAMTVKIDNFTFQPKELEVGVGTTVTWQNADDVPHTATSKDDPQTFDSGALDTDDKFTFTFSKPGKYPYYCKVHPHMTGLVTVK